MVSQRSTVMNIRGLTNGRQGSPPDKSKGMAIMAVRAFFLFFLLTPTLSLAGFQDEWKQLIAAAKKEGKISMSVGPLRYHRSVLNVFSKKFGIKVKAQTGRGAFLADRWLAERRARRKLVDIGLISVASTSRRLAPGGAIQPIEPLLIHPEVTDKSLWYNGEHSYADWFVKKTGGKGSFIYGSRIAEGYLFWYNTKKVKKEDVADINSLWDFLKDPKWKGKLADRTYHDPGRLGPALLAYFFPDLGKEFLVQYYEKVAGWTDDDKLLETWLAKGRYPVRLQPGSSDPGSTLVQLMQAGIPIAFKQLQSPQGWMEARGSTCCIVVAEGPPNPNAAKLFLNWWLSREAQTLLHKVDTGGGVGINQSSLRNDITQGLVSDINFRDPGKTYLFRDTDPRFSGKEQEKARQWIVKNFKKITGFLGSR